ncbi:thermonuclease family protein [Dichotomicrobium thermohalophilum]|uniref:thermonuclease family protein n=1 Tax=Dichotomicrobium thermohalophilum TaxID=933063 RepID=UPI001FE0D3D1|nr:thermonuclease family protein [Dichotomicrobium thermohalophilum]
MLIAIAVGLVAGAVVALLVPQRDAADRAPAERPGTFRLVPREAPDVRYGAALPDRPDRIVGRASVIDGDTIEIRGQSIRLFGIDALEDDQKCLAGGKRQRCAQRAANALSEKIGRRNVLCEKRARDRYDRIVGVCYADGEDLNAWLVAEGWALAYRRYSRLYVEHEEKARRANKGVWATRFVKPWEARRGKRLGQRVATRRCAIKGNISAAGERIYHVPGGYYYGQTRVDESEGERWFCSEAEARAAGWRPALR